MILKKVKKRLLRRAFGLMGPEVKGRLLRRFVKVDLEPTSNLTFKLAETKEELESAFKLLHDAYVSEGFMQPDPSGIRLTPYHALPTTSTLIVKHKNEVIGTVSLITRTALGLPLEKIIDLKQIEFSGARMVEISSLAIRPDFRNQHHILFLLCKFLYEYCMKYFAMDYMVIAVNPRQEDLYKHLFLFEHLTSKVVENYDFVNGAPAVGLFMDLRKAHNRLMSVYRDVPIKRNLYAFFMEAKPPINFIFPKRAYNQVFDAVMTPELLNYFFNERTQIFNLLDDFQLSLIRASYNQSIEHLKIIPTPKNNSFVSSLRQSVRYPVQCKAVLRDEKTSVFNLINITEVSSGGFYAQSVDKIEWGSVIQGRVQINNFEFSMIEARLIWKSSTGEAAGYALVSSDESWNRLIGFLSNEVNRQSLQKVGG